ncbi:MAG: CHAT domain-containing protein [Cytophagales bacterium]|nr:CHAT domain-containing protein [Cytophagales bacterium]
MNRFIFILLLCFSQLGFSSQFHKEHHKIHRYIVGGNYKHALKNNKKLIKKINKKLSDSTQIVGKLLIQQAFIKSKMDEPFTTLKKNYTEGLSYIEKAKGKDSREYTEGLLDIFDIYLDKGYYIEADSLLNSIKKSQKDSSVAKQIKLKEIPFLMDLGYYTTAQKQATELKSYVLGGIKETVRYKKKKKFVTKKLPQGEYMANKRVYADHLHLIAKTLILKGDYDEAQKVLDKTKLWIEQEITQYDISMVDNLYLKGLIANQKNHPTEAQIFFEDALKLIGHTHFHFQYLETSPQYGDLIEQLAMAYWADNKTEQATDLVNDYSPRIKRTYSRDNFHRGFLRLLGAEKQYIKKHFDKAGKEGKKFIEKGLHRTDNYALQHKSLVKLIPIYEKLEEYEMINYVYNSIDSLKNLQFPSNSPRYHEDEIYKAIYYTRYTTKFQDARVIFEESFAKVVKQNLHPTHPKYRHFSNSYANLEEIIGNYREAEKITEEIFADTKKYFDATDYRIAQQWLRLVNLNIETGKYEKAKEQLKQIEGIYNLEINKHAEGRDKLYVYYGKLYLLTGQYGEAEEALSKAQKYSKNSKFSQQDIAEFATLYIKQGDYSKVEEILHETLKIKEEIYGRDSRHLVVALNQLSELYLITGNYSKATEHIDRSLQIAFKIYGNKSLKYTNALKLQAKIEATIGDFDHALNDYNEVLVVEEQLLGKKHIAVASSLTEKAMTQFAKDSKTENILELLNESASIIEQQLGKENPLYAEALQHIASYHTYMGQLDTANQYLQQANDIWIQKAGLGKVNINSTNILVLRADILKRQNKQLEALELLKQAGKQYKKLFHKEHPDYVKTLSKMAQLYYVIGDEKRAVRKLNQTTEIYTQFITNYFDGLSERQRAKFWYLIRPDFEFYNTVAINSGKKKLIAKAYNHTLQTKAILLNSSISLHKTIANSKDEVLIKKFEQWQAKKEQLSSHIGLSTEQLAEQGISLNQEVKEISALEKELSESSDAFRKQKLAKSYTWKDVRSKLKENEYAIEIIRYRYFDKEFSDSIIYAALLISPTTKKAPQVIMLESGNQLESKYISYYRNTIKYQIEDEYSYKVFWEKIHKVVGNNSTIYLSTDGVYNQINLESVITPDKNYVLDKNNIVLVTNTKDLLKRRKKSTTSLDVVLLGNPAFYDENIVLEEHGNRSIDQTVAQLPGAEEEVKNIHKLLMSKGWNSNQIIYEHATEGFVSDTMESPRILHFATHGFFLDDVEVNEEDFGFISRQEMNNPLLRSGLMLQHAGDIFESEEFYNFNKEDGILTADEARNLQLENTEIVVLSACETGLGEVQVGEGVQGLQQSFLVAGAQTVFMSLFKVSDEATNLLMSTFYKNYLETGDKRQAFIDAKKTVREKYPEPIYWGAFIMIGL